MNIIKASWTHTVYLCRNSIRGLALAVFFISVCFSASAGDLWDVCSLQTLKVCVSKHCCNISFTLDSSPAPGWFADVLQDVQTCSVMKVSHIWALCHNCWSFMAWFLLRWVSVTKSSSGFISPSLSQTVFILITLLLQAHVLQYISVCLFVCFHLVWEFIYQALVLEHWKGTI